MDFYAVLDQVVELLRSRQRVTYRTLKRVVSLNCCDGQIGNDGHNR